MTCTSSSRLASVLASSLPRAISARPPKAKKAIRAIRKAATKAETIRNSGLPGISFLSTTPLVMEPKMPIGLKEPAVAPWTIIMPMSIGWIL